MDTFSLDELNFFAKRLASLPNEELPVFYAVTEQIFNDADENPVSIKDLINCTYGLDTVPVAHNVSNLPSSVGLLSKTVCFPISMTFPKRDSVFKRRADRQSAAENDSGVFEAGCISPPSIMTDRRYMTA